MFDLVRTTTCVRVNVHPGCNGHGSIRHICLINYSYSSDVYMCSVLVNASCSVHGEAGSIGDTKGSALAAALEVRDKHVNSVYSVIAALAR